MTEQLTILTTTGARHFATKEWRRTPDGWLKTDFSAGSEFSHQSVPVDGVQDIATALDSVSRRDFVIRGEIKPEMSDQELVRRRKQGDGAAFDEVARQWVMLDFDDVPLAPHCDLVDDPEGAIEWMIAEYLPLPFQDVTSFWQLSSSAGMKGDGTISAHVWYWLDRKISNVGVKAYFKAQAPAVDPALFQAVQPHFVAAPIFVGGGDPLPRRSGVLDLGEDHAILPEIDVGQLKRDFKTMYPAAATGGSFDDRLAQMGDGPGLGRFHGPLRDTIMAAVRGGLDLARMQALKARLRSAIMAAPKKPGRDVKHYLSDQYLDTSIQGALQRRENEIIDVAKAVLGGDEVSLDDGQRQLDDAILKWTGKARDHNPDRGDGEIHVIAAELGLGKTERILYRLAHNFELSTKRVHLYVPQHKLAREVIDRFNAMRRGGTPAARLHQGRDRTDGDDHAVLGENGQPMCFDDVREKADIYARVGLSVSENFCPTCPHADECGWQHQRGDKGPGLVIMPNDYAFEDTAKRADAQIFDESFWGKALPGGQVAMAVLLRPDPVPQRKGRGDDVEAMADLGAARSKLLAAFKDGVPTIPQLREAGITAEIAGRAKAIEHQRADAIGGIISPQMSLRAMERAISKFPHRDARLWARVWDMIEKQIDLDRDQLHGFRVLPDGMISVKWATAIRNADAPTLVLDATADRQILGRVFGREIEAWTDIKVKSPHARIVQVSDRAVGKGMIAPNPEYDPADELQRKRNRARDLAHIVEIAAAGRDKAAVITYQLTEAEIAEKLPDNVTTGHFNAIRGLDQWGDVDALVIAGRTQPSEAEVEHMTEGLFYDSPVEIKLAGKYARTMVKVAVGDQVREMETDAHPDPLVEAVRHQICEAELTQAIGRARAIRRTADDPVEIVLVTCVPVARRVDALTTWDELVPGRLEVAAARGVMLSSNADLAAAYPDLFKNAKAAMNARRGASPSTASFPYNRLYIGEKGCAPTEVDRSRTTPFPYKRSHIGKKGTPPTEVHYQLAGASQKRKTAYYCHEQVADIRVWMTDTLGAVMVFEVVGVEAAPSESAISEEIPAATQENDTPDQYDGGLLSDVLVRQIRAMLRGSGLKQDQIAASIGISRPQLTNALAQRFGLGDDPARRLMDFLAAPPPVVQPALF